MALSDCSKCWSSPCSCGWYHKDSQKDYLSKHIAAITQYRSKEEAKQIIERAKQIVDENKDWYDESKRDEGF